MPAGTFTSADKAQYGPILDAIESIAKTAPGMTDAIGWTGSMKRRFPLMKELVTAGYPYLVVFRPEQVKDSNPTPREGGRVIEKWHYVLYGLYPYLGMETQDATYTTPEEVMARLVQAFRVYYTLNRTCSSCVVTDHGYSEVEIGDKPLDQGPGKLFMSVYVTLLVTIRLAVNNTQTP